VQAPAQCWGHWGGQSPDQHAIVDDVREVPVQAECDAAPGQGLPDADVSPGEGDQPGGVDDPVDLDRHR
jgi:hypothetical protein